MRAFMQFVMNGCTAAQLEAEYPDFKTLWPAVLNWADTNTSEAKAFAFFEAAAALEYTDAINHLAVCYELGFGVAADPAKAFELLEKCANMGHVRSMCNLGAAYESGKGVDRDLRKAAELYTRASELGDDAATLYLAEFYDEGIVFKSDQKRAAELYEKAANMGNASAQNSFGVCLQQGIGVPKDEVRAVQFYSASAEQGHPDGMCNLGLCYDSGVGGVVANKAHAFSLYLKAANHDLGIASYYVAWCLRDGIGTSPDKKKAEAYFKAAAEQGFMHGRPPQPLP
jgi:hypothetical protein